MFLPTNLPVGKVTGVTTRDRILDAALDVVREGGSVSLESAARRTELTKPGLMYHFPTKEALMLALVDHVVDRWMQELSARVPESSDAAARYRAYLDWSLSGEFDHCDLVMLVDPRLREPLMARWAERLGPWLELPAGLDARQRARFTAVRLLADGAWFADATDVLAPTAEERTHVRELADGLLGTP